MKTRNEIMQIIDAKLAAIHNRKYTLHGSPLLTVDPSVISIDYKVTSTSGRGLVNVYGKFEGWLTLKPQIDNQSTLNDYPKLVQDITADLAHIAESINNEI